MNDLGFFPDSFKSLTGESPFRWQERLYGKFVCGDLPNVCDLPTGLGKTMIMAIWLIARTENPKLPRRLVYVVDRRTVVDQATDLAKMLKDNVSKELPSIGKLNISTLRGQLADNREWSRDPSKPAIIIGTVDLIGSALLFSGYRSSFKRRPLEAGLLGQDSLLVLDEAHLSRPFEKLVKVITQFQKNQGSPMQVIRMSATSGNSDQDEPERRTPPRNKSGVFRLDTNADSPTYDLEPDPDPTTGEERNQLIRRYQAKKRLTVITANKLVDAIAAAAGTLAEDHPGTRIVIFVKTPKLADDVRKALIKKDKSRETKVAMLTGRMRGLERDELVTEPDAEDQHERRVMQRFLQPENDQSQRECFLISTSAGEVGFDLNADHLIGDAAPLDSWIQRLGRVNRRGDGNATVILVKEKEPADKTEFQEACSATSDLLSERLEDVSLKSLATFRESLTAEEISKTSTPIPTMVELTDILLDAWSMTSITGPMPGRPEVAPWLRGIADDLPQTTIAWRAELDLFKDHPTPQKALKRIFAKHPVRPHESLTTNSYHVVEFLKSAVKPKGGRPELRDVRVVIKLSRDIVVRTIGEVIDNNGILNADPTLILPATFGGLDGGILSHDAIPSPPEAGDPEPQLFDIADNAGYERREDFPARLRILIERTNEGWEPKPLPGGKLIREELDLESVYDTSTNLFKSLVKLDFRVRLVQPVKVDDEGNATLSLVLLAPVGDKSKPVEQTLEEHVGLVETEARRIVDELDLEDPIRAAMLFAAKWHDEGKKAAVWQSFIGGPKDGQPLGKAATIRDPKLLRGYRHEFGSLLSLHHTERRNTGCSLPADPETRDLALHLIATHHGFGKPHFDNPIDRDFRTGQCDWVHTETIRRFARLQGKYGWWYLAWLENLLRSADALASADEDAEDDEADRVSEEAGGNV